MIKFKIQPKIWEGGGANLGKCWENVCLSYIFWDILKKMKDNLGQESVKGGLLSSQGKTGTISLISLEK